MHALSRLGHDSPVTRPADYFPAEGIFGHPRPLRLPSPFSSSCSLSASWAGLRVPKTASCHQCRRCAALNHMLVARRVTCERSKGAPILSLRHFVPPPGRLVVAVDEGRKHLGTWSLKALAAEVGLLPLLSQAAACHRAPEPAAWPLNRVDLARARPPSGNAKSTEICERGTPLLNLTDFACHG